MAATTFHLFSHLPWELRAQIWELTITPRTVEVQFLANKPQDNLQLVQLFPPFSSSDPLASRRRPPRLFSPIPVPAALHTCREARKHLTFEVGSSHQAYERTFEADLPRSGSPPRPPKQPRRYVYVNFDFDTLLLRDGTSLHHFVLSPFVQQQDNNNNTRIKRLVIERNTDMARWYFQSSEPSLLKSSSFSPYLEDLVIISDDTRDCWFEEAEAGGVFGLLLAAAPSSSSDSAPPENGDGNAPPSPSIQNENATTATATATPSKPKLTVTRYPTLLDYQLSEAWRPLLKTQIKKDGERSW
ncbi:hypothetical protein B0H65DRAFT_63852 [Neurospora tetraspora]|uniref:2EXR domain-containing protein n=1 Tax=Neurospora tetraspora TaxID=94610 RepID=A0AAE0MWW5_9PEZI|nr:hypothetical protein B0H65DRAFT_63852 [Neurospora tetraspora]